MNRSVALIAVDPVCAQTDPELWFPEKGGDSRPAKRLCRSCPYLMACRRYALERTELQGIWGGLTERERRRVRRAGRVAEVAAAGKRLEVAA